MHIFVLKLVLILLCSLSSNKTEQNTPVLVFAVFHIGSLFLLIHGPIYYVRAEKIKG